MGEVSRTKEGLGNARFERAAYRSGEGSRNIKISLYGYKHVFVNELADIDCHAKSSAFPFI